MLRLGPAFRSLIFTALVPVVIAYFLPRWLGFHATISLAGWLLIVPGILIYTLCLIRFLAAGGTPAIFFTRPLRFLIGETPAALVSEGLYRYSRNPMYLGVLLIMFGQGFVSYGVIVWICFHAVVVLLEEPQLRKQNGEPYDEYRRKIPRWFLRLPISKPNLQ
jgi:protein-S-isoprenylcysteine O-methyltransferase Ste14